MKKHKTAVLLASGFSKRMGKNKLLLPINGKPMIMHVLDMMRQIEDFNLIVVTSYPEIEKIARQYDCQVVLNTHPDRGQSYSIIQGVRHSMLTDGWLFLNGDMPFLNKEVILNILDKIDTHQRQIIIPRYHREPGSPVYFSYDFKDKLLNLQGDQGGRQIIKDYPEHILYVDIADERCGLDIDTLDVYERLKDRHDERKTDCN